MFHVKQRGRMPPRDGKKQELINSTPPESRNEANPSRIAASGKTSCEQTDWHTAGNRRMRMFHVKQPAEVLCPGRAASGYRVTPDGRGMAEIRGWEWFT